jgi:hypothetical protein
VCWVDREEGEDVMLGIHAVERAKGRGKIKCRKVEFDYLSIRDKREGGNGKGKDRNVESGN